MDKSSLEQLSTQGLGALPDLFPVLLNAVMQIEWQKHLGAAPHERTQERTGHANGYKDKTLNTRLGQITVAVPQVREVNEVCSRNGKNRYAKASPPVLDASPPVLVK